MLQYDYLALLDDTVTTHMYQQTGFESQRIVSFCIIHILADRPNESDMYIICEIISCSFYKILSGSFVCTV